MRERHSYDVRENKEQNGKKAAFSAIARVHSQAIDLCACIPLTQLNSCNTHECGRCILSYPYFSLHLALSHSCDLLDLALLFFIYPLSLSLVLQYVKILSGSIAFPRSQKITIENVTSSTNILNEPIHYHFHRINQFLFAETKALQSNIIVTKRIQPFGVFIEQSS